MREVRRDKIYSKLVNQEMETLMGGTAWEPSAKAGTALASSEDGVGEHT